MKHQDAIETGRRVQEAIKHLDDLYVSIIIKENGGRQVVIRKKGVDNAN